MAKSVCWSATLYSVTDQSGETAEIMVSGRDRWALEALIAAGSRGCTPINTPGPRWSGYVHKLRKLGVDIETVTEPHEGQFPGHHARYVLRSAVSGITERWQA